ncbi:MAG: hypothetical protein F4X81_15275 [Gammaproteobacteria bacterium]|nr:hypothetical protein [Gammaproteobacteria bacterium]MYE52818.1 hypothetical protein [Gammaproteobacteria bacterium]
MPDVQCQKLNWSRAAAADAVKIVNWNVQWATPKSPRQPEILRRLETHEPEVVCLTETDVALLPWEGHVVCSAHSGYQGLESRRKVLLWSREPWRNVDRTGDSHMPPGRFIRATTRTSAGDLTIMGVCIPWSGSRTGPAFTPRRRRWEDHYTYLECLDRLLGKTSLQRLVVVGDFNQRIRHRPRPSRLASALHDAVSSHLTIATSALGWAGRRTIDHIALSADLHCEALGVIDNIHDERRLSDHFGVFADVHAAKPGARKMKIETGG